MNNIGAGFIGGIIGVALGGAATYFFCNKTFKEKYKDLVRKSVDDTRDHYEGIIAKIKGEEKTLDEVVVEALEEAKDKLPSVSEYGDIPTVDIPKTDYASIIKKHYNVDAPGDEDTPVEGRIPVRKEPFVISHAAYIGDDPAMEHDDYEKIELNWYTKDYIYDEVTDEERNIEIIYSVDEDETYGPLKQIKCLGMDWKNYVGYNNRDDEDDLGYDYNEVCVRNDALKTDYIIYKSDTSYKEDILGISGDYDYSEELDG